MRRMLSLVAVFCALALFCSPVIAVEADDQAVEMVPTEVVASIEMTESLDGSDFESPLPATAIETASKELAADGSQLRSEFWEPCVQGAYCGTDSSVCGPEGFCNFRSGCCMCY